MEPNPYEAPKETSEIDVSGQQTHGGVMRVHVTLVLGCIGIGAWPAAHILLTPHEVPLPLKVIAALVSIVSAVAIAEGVWKLD